jgi:hypothetical protein
VVKRQRGSQATLERAGWPDLVWAFHEGDELGPKTLARIAKRPGLRPEDLQRSVPAAKAVLEAQHEVSG